MSSQKQTKSPLIKAFSFGKEDLAANKQGKLTTRQKKTLDQHIRISRFSSGLAVFAALASIIVMAGVLVFIPQGSAIKQAAPYLAGTAFVFFVIMSVFTFIGLRRLRTLRNQEVDVIEGQIRLSAKSLDYGTMKAHYARIGKMRFQLTTQQQTKALVDGNEYRIYYIHYPPTHIILSVEEMA